MSGYVRRFVAAGAVLATALGLAVAGQTPAAAQAGSSADVVHTARVATQAASPAVVGAPGSISGTITSGGSPAENVCAEAYLATSSYDIAGSGCSDVSGAYTVTGLLPGVYTVQFVDADAARHDAPQWYIDKSDPTSWNDLVTVNSGAATTGIDAAMAAGGQITGTVTDKSTGDPIANLCVDVTDAADGQGAGEIPAAADSGCTALTGSDGTYKTGGLVSGSYNVSVNDEIYSGVYNPGYARTSSIGGATRVSGASAVSADVALDPAVAITGSVTDGGGPLAGADVAFTTAAYPVGTVTTATTAADGSYTANVPPGSYVVEFSAPAGKPFDAGASRNLTVKANTPQSGVDGALTAGGEITGTVTDAQGSAISGADVAVSPADNSENYYGDVTTSADGSYDLTGVPAGTYTVQFNSPYEATYLSEYLGGVVVGGDTTGTTVTVVAGETSSSTDATMANGATISGNVADASGNPLTDVCVEIQPTGSTNYYPWSYGCTDDSGNYTTAGLAPGTYQLTFDDYSGRYLSATKSITVSGTTDQTGQDVTLQLGGVINGTVTDTNGNGVSGACVDVEDGGGNYVGSDCADSSGVYSVGPLPTGTYAVDFYANGYDGATSGSATVAAGRITPGVDTTLTAEGSISGTISQAGSPLAGICAEAYQADDSYPSASGCSGDDGKYTVTALPAGTYRVQFVDSDTSRHDAPQWHSGTVTVTDNNDSSGIDASMADGGQITGTVTAGGKPVAGVCVRIYDSSTGDSAGGIAQNNTWGEIDYNPCTDDQGNYVTGGLDPADTYQVVFDPDESDGYATQWYDGVSTQADAKPVSATAGAQTGGIDAALISLGSISGTITQVSGGSAAANVCAEIYTASDQYNPVASDCSDNTGHYTVPGLAAGNYLVQFVDGDTVRHDEPQWYKGKSDFGSADFVSVSDGNVTQNINAVMDQGGWITGTITDSSTTDPIADVCVSVYDTASYDNAGGTASTYGPGIDYNICSDSAGKYVTGAMAPGTYEVDVNYYNGDSGYSTQTSTVTVSKGAATTSDAQLEPTVSVSGTVTDSSDVGIDAAVVEISGNGTDVSATADANGTYTAEVPPGDYTVKFAGPDGSDYVAQEVNQTVVAATPLTGLDAKLVMGGAISGTVTDQDGNAPLSDVDVYVYAAASDFYAYSYTDSNGTYTIHGVPAGTDYTVDFSGSESVPYLTIDKNSVSVTATATTTVDASMTHGATFSGTVTDKSTGNPLSNVCVSVVPTGETKDNAVAESCTDSTGDYTTPAVPSGSYQLDFVNYSGRYIEQWYDGASSQAGATTLTVTQPENKAVDTVGMQLGGTVSGSVTDANGNALSGICTTLYTTDGNWAGDGGCTDDSGQYTSAPVAAGTYKVGFSDSSGTYASEYYKDATSLADATTVTVALGANTTLDTEQLGSTGLPGAPTITGVTASDGSATVEFTAPASDGGSNLTGYVITPNPACAGTCGGLTPTAGSTSATVTGLTNGTAYTFTVQAVNKNGPGPSSAPSESVTPQAAGGGGTTTAPGAPTNVQAFVAADTTKVTVKFDAPTSDGGSSITGYTVVPSPACAACTGTSVSGSPATISGLKTGTAYTFTVKATNDIGTSNSSAASNAVTPTAAPQSPESTTAVDAGTPATVTNDGTTATASGGTGTVTVSQYPSNPAATPTFDPSGAYLDVSVSQDSTFDSVVIQDCNLNGGTSLQWWNPDAGTGGAWQAVTGHPTDTSGLPACLSVTIDASSSPTIAQLTGTIFAAVAPAAAGGGGGGGGTGGTGGTGGSTPCSSAPFPDVPASSTFCGDITWLKGQQITAGYADGDFHPTQPISRQAMAAFLYRLENPGKTAPACTSAPYPDVDVASTFCGAITWLKGQQITTGYADGDFHPTAAISRQAMAAFLYRLENPGKTAPACTSAPFTDVPITSQFCGDIAWLKEQKITTGYADAGFQPTTSISRQAMAAFLHRLPS